jgi:sterol 14-demethylase
MYSFHFVFLTLFFIFLLLLLCSSSVAKVLAEQNALGLTDPSAPLDLDKLNNMEYLHNCMREALRLHPPLILLMRKLKKDVPVKNKGVEYVIPKGHTVMVSPSVAGRIGTVFKDPDVFDPDRFAEGREEHKTPYAYLGFGGGMHSCMGQQFAFMQVCLFISLDGASE